MWPKIGQSRGPSNIYTNWVISNCFHLRSSKNKRWCLDSDRALQLGCHASTWDTKPGRVHDPNWFELQTKTLKTQGLSYSSVVQHLHNIDKALGPIPVSKKQRHLFHSVFLRLVWFLALPRSHLAISSITMSPNTEQHITMGKMGLFTNFQSSSSLYYNFF